MDQLQPDVISKDQAVPDSSRPACKSPVSRSAQACKEIVQVSSHKLVQVSPHKPSQPVHQSLPAATVPTTGCDATLAAIAASLPVGPTDAYIAALNAPPAAEMEYASDTSSVKSLARAHGYDDAGPCDDAPCCPSYYSDDGEEEDPGGGRWGYADQTKLLV